jgi:hypothetical protein
MVKSYPVKCKSSTIIAAREICKRARFKTPNDSALGSLSLYATEMSGASTAFIPTKR